jgi:APA family basic amino acid/polyamine antiporter
LGELPAWIVGWNLSFEYAFAGAAVATTIASFFRDLLTQLGAAIPQALEPLPSSITLMGEPFLQFDFLSFIFVMFIAFLLTFGVKATMTLSNVATCVNLITLTVIIIVGAMYSNPTNWTPFAPKGWDSTINGAFRLFFSFLGFNTICTLSGEAKNPSRDIPLSMIGTILVAGLLYICIGLVLTAMQPYDQIVSGSPLQSAFRAVGVPAMSYVVGVCKCLIYEHMHLPGTFTHLLVQVPYPP